MKKAVSLFLAALLASSCVACSGAPAADSGDLETNGTAEAGPSPASEAGGGSTGEKRTITWMDVWTSGRPLMEKIAQDYMDAHPNFAVEFVRPGERTSYYQQLKILAASNDLPEIFDSDGDAMLAEIASTGVLVDIDEMYAEFGYDRMMPVGLNYARLANGKLYTIAWENNIEYFWYNKNLFAQAGIEKTPETFDELLESCEKLKNAGITPVAVFPGWHAMRWLSFIPFRLTNNDYVEKLKVGEAKMSDPIGIQAAEFFQTMGTNYFMPGWATADYTDALEAFLGGNAAIYNIGTWEFPSFLDENNEIKEEFDFFYLPTLPGAVNGKTTAMCAHAGTGTSVRKETFDEDVKDFVKYVLEVYPETAFYEFGIVPPMTFDTTKGDISDFYKQVLDDSDKLEESMYTWDVRLDSASNEVLIKEIENLGMGTITPQEFANRIDAAIEENAPKFFN